MDHQWVTNESWITIRGRPQLDSEQQNPRMPHGAQRGDFLTCQVFELFDLWHAGAGAKWQAFRIRVRLKCTQVSVTEWHRGNITVIWVILWGTGRYSGKCLKESSNRCRCFSTLPRWCRGSQQDLLAKSSVTALMENFGNWHSFTGFTHV